MMLKYRLPYPSNTMIYSSPGIGFMSLTPVNRYSKPPPGSKTISPPTLPIVYGVPSTIKVAVVSGPPV
jgi:hypothetical protein